MRSGFDGLWSWEADITTHPGDHIMKCQTTAWMTVAHDRRHAHPCFLKTTVAVRTKCPSVIGMGNLHDPAKVADINPTAGDQPVLEAPNEMIVVSIAAGGRQE